MHVIKKMVYFVLLGWLLPSWLLLVCATSAIAAPLIMGSISSEPVGEIRLFNPVVRYLAKQLAPLGITKGRVVVAASMKEMSAFLKSGRVDFYLDSPMPSLVVNQLSGSKMLLRRWKKGVAEYHSVIFVQRDSPVQTLSQLSGKRMGFDNPYSSSGHILPRIAMIQAGLNLEQLTDFRAKVPEGKVGYIFNDDDENTMVRVLMGRIAAGTMSAKSFKKNAKGDVDKLRIIHETFAIPRHIVNVRGGMPEKLEKALYQALKGMEHNAEGQAILKGFEKTVRFDDVPAETHVRMQQITPIVLEIMSVNP